jgi:hypothetical protein
VRWDVGWQALDFLPGEPQPDGVAGAARPVDLVGGQRAVAAEQRP